MQVEVLGPVAIIDETGSRKVLKGRNGQLVAALALHAGRAVADDLLADSLWPEEVPPDAAATLRTYVARLRPQVAPIDIGREAGGYLLELDPACVDATEFEQRVTAGLAAWRHGDAARCAEELRAAQAIWHGRPWSALDGWMPADLEAARLEELRDQADEYEAAATLALGDHQAAAAELLALTEARPLRELRWELLMRALVAQGRQADALRTFQRARAYLVEELGIEPSAPLLALERAVLDRSDLGPLLPGRPMPSADAGTAAARSRPSPGAAVAERDPLVGRVELVHELRRLISTLRAGGPHVAVLEGEPGVGKTRLLAAVVDLAADAGVEVYEGRCFEAEASGPYRPLVDVLRRIVTRVEVPAADRAHLGVLLPELAEVGPDSGEDRQLLMFDASTRLVRAAASRGGAVIMLDDLQWADPASLDLLAHVLRHVGDADILVVVSRRPPSPVGTDRPANWLAQVARTTPVSRFEVAGLDRDEIAQIARRIAPDLDDATIAGLHDVTGGNPLYVRELAYVLRERARTLGELLVSLPSGVADLLRARLGALPPDAADLLRLAALDPAGVPVDLLRAAFDGTAAELDAVLDDTVAAGVLVERADDGQVVVGFSHELLRVASLDGLRLARQAALHHSLALAGEGLLTRDHDRWIGSVASHWFEAGRSADPIRAESANVDAAHIATRRTAFGDAQTHLTWAVAAFDWQHLDPDEHARRGGPLHLALAEASHRVADVTARRANAELAFALAEQVGDAATAARAAIVHGGSRSTYGISNPATTRLLRRATELLDVPGDVALDDDDPAGDDPADVGLAARTLARLAQEVNHAGALDDSREMSARAVDMARFVDDDDRTAAAVFRERVWTLNHPDWLGERETTIDAMLDRARRAKEPELEMEARIWRASARLERADVVGFDEELAHLDALARRAPVPVLLVRIETLRSTRAAFAGDFDTAMRHAQAGYELGQRVEPENADQVLQAQMIAPLRELGLLSGMLPTVEELAGAYRDVPGWRCALTFVLVEAGDHDGGRRELAALRRIGLDAVPRDLAWSLALAYLADATCTLGDVDVAADLVPRMAPFAGRNASLWDIASHGAVDHHLGRLLALLGDDEAAVRHLDAALALHRSSDQGPMALRSELELALAARRARGSTPSAEVDTRVEAIERTATAAGWPAIAAAASVALAAG